MQTIAGEPTALDAKPTRRRAPKSPKSQKLQEAGRSKVSLYLSDRTAKLLAVHATMEDKSMSDLAESIFAEKLKLWVVSHHRAKSAGGGDPDSEVDRSDAA